MKRITFVFLLFFISCSTQLRMSHKQKGIDPTFEPYVTEYRHLIGKDKFVERFDKLSINFKDLDDKTVGRCFWLVLGGYEIEINEKWWKYYMFYPEVKELVMYHELEHCIRYRFHTDKKEYINSVSDFFERVLYYIGIIPENGYLRDGCPVSIMHSQVMSHYCRNKHYEYYIQEIIKYKP